MNSPRNESRGASGLLFASPEKEAPTKSWLAARQAIVQACVKAPTLATVLAIVLAIMGALAPTTPVLARTVYDSQGQAIEVPENVTKVASLNPAFALMTEMLTLGGGKVAAYLDVGLSKYFKKIFPDIVASNPNGYSSNSVEDILASGTEVVLGPVSRLSDDQIAQLRKSGVAVVAVTGVNSVEEMCQSYLIIGDILGPEERARAEEFAAYYRGNEEKARRLTESIPRSERKRFLFLNGGGSSLGTVNSRDLVHEHLTSAGGVNVAADYMPLSRGLGAAVGIEQILVWEPELIVTGSPAVRDEILASNALADVPAVKSGRVKACPHGIFNWSAKSGEGAMMALWLVSQMYPERYSEAEAEAMVVDFFKRFYDYDLPAEELSEMLLGESMPK